MEKPRSPFVPLELLDGLDGHVDRRTAAGRGVGLRGDLLEHRIGNAGQRAALRPGVFQGMPRQRFDAGQDGHFLRAARGGSPRPTRR